MPSLRFIAIVALLGTGPAFAQADRLAQKLDDAFARGELGQYFDLFGKSSLHDYHRDLLRSQFDQILTFKELSIETMVASQSSVGEIGIAVLETSVIDKNGAIPLYSYVAFREQKDETQALFTLEAPHSSLNLGARSFRCPPCNFEIAFGDEWFAVPVQSAQSGCMEAMLLLSLEHDISLEAAVEVNDLPIDAKAAISRFLARVRKTGQLGEAEDPVFIPWQPAGIPSPAPAGMTSMRCVCQCTGGNVAELNLITVGRLQYLVVVRGPKEAIDSHRADIDRVLNSFHLLEPNLAPSDLSKASIQAHTGDGKLEGSTYSNPTVELSFSGPEGWIGSVSAGAYIFKVDYRCAESDSRLIVAAYEPPPGESWTKEPASDFIRRNFPGFQAGAWQKKQAGLLWCEAETENEFLGAAIRSDVLLIMTGDAKIPVAKDLIRAAMTTLTSDR